MNKTHMIINWKVIVLIAERYKMYPDWESTPSLSMNGNTVY